MLIRYRERAEPDEARRYLVRVGVIMSPRWYYVGEGADYVRCTADIVMVLIGKLET